MDILKIRFRTNTEFSELFQGDLEHGGLFCPTTSEYKTDAPILVELSFPAIPNKILIRGTVRSWRPALPRLRVRAGAFIEFLPEENDKRDFLLRSISGKAAPPVKRKHIRLPVDMAVQFRTDQSIEMQECNLTEISVGGVMLATTTPLPLGTDIILEIHSPGSAKPISISGKASYHAPGGGTGVRFMNRDAAGSHRLKELVRRLRDN